jgi:hypothetical protein
VNRPEVREHSDRFMPANHCEESSTKPAYHVQAARGPIKQRGRTRRRSGSAGLPSQARHRGRLASWWRP